MDDSSLIKKLQIGEEKAYEILFKRHYSVLCLYATKFIGNTYVAEDLVSDVIYNLWVKRSEINIKSSVRNYLIQAVKYRCFNYIKQEQRRNEIVKEFFDSSTNEYLELSYKDNPEHPVTSILLKELDLKLEEAIAKLPETTREVFLQSRYSNLKYTEIAENMNLSVDSIKYHIKSALSKLKKELSNYDYLLLMLFYFSQK